MKISFIILLLFALLGCSSNKFPKKNYQQCIILSNKKQVGDTTFIEIANTLMCPLRFNFFSKNDTLNKILKKRDTITIKEFSDTRIRFYNKNKHQIEFKADFGSCEKIVTKKPIQKPFRKNKYYEVVQGYGGTYSHNKENSYYAIDFALKTGDTICSADDGYVVGVIKDYEFGGTTKKWRTSDKSNFITIYHPETGIFTQYAHLKQNGSLVMVGDTIKKGQPIGLSGNTGFSSGEHLHFNTLIPKKGKGFISTPVDFEN